MQAYAKRQQLLQEVRRLERQVAELDRLNRDLAERANTDGLTLLYNHRFIMECCMHEIARSKRYNDPLSCVIIDIDHFKEINDTYGHQFGDFVLKELGVLLREYTRKSDRCGRYGGEEFMLLARLPLKELVEYVFRLHTLIAGHAFISGEKQARITVSMGVSEYDCSMTSWHELVNRADQALYKAKNSGRNVVRVWSDEQPETDHSENREIALLKTQFAELYKSAKSSYVQSTNALLKAIDAKDSYTLNHSVNVATYAVMLATAAGLDELAIETIKNAALLHDVGKIGISEKILTKRTPLLKTEYERLKKHPQIGANIIKDIGILSREVPIILHHHERYDGEGYPQGLRANEIPTGAKILAVADAFDAMTTTREFRNKLTQKEAIKVLVAEKGRQFDPDLVDTFIAALADSDKKATTELPTAILFAHPAIARHWEKHGRYFPM